MEQEAQLSYLLERQLQLLIEQATKKYDKDIAELKSQLGAARQDIETLRSTVKNLRNERPAVEAPRPASPRVEETPKSPQHDMREQVASAAPNQSVSFSMARTGNYKSDDVSVDKFFYFGNKR